MSNNKDDQKPDPLRAADPKRPHATIDLKAVEIKAAETKGADPKTATSTPGSPTSPAGAATSAAGSAASAAAPNKPDAAKAAPISAQGAAKPADTKAPINTSNTSAAKSATATAAPNKPEPTPPPPVAHRSGFGSFISHSTAGLLGGFLALLGADTIAPQLGQLGLPLHSATSEATQKLDTRLAALEKSQSAASKSGDTLVKEQLAATQARGQQLEQMAARATAAAEANEQLKKEMQQLAAKLAQAPATGAGPDPRIAKLEEQLAMLASASDGGKAGGSVPALAAVTGKLADLEQTLANQLAALRKSVSEEMESRVAKAAEAAEAARSGAQRVDREMADVKTGAARLNQRMEAFKADSDRVGEALRVVQEETGKLASGLDVIKGDIAARFKAAAKPEDIATAIAPVAGKVAALEANVTGVVSSEESRKSNAERIVLSLELANMKRAIDRGQGYAEELAQVQKAAAGKINLAALEKYKTEGVPTLTELQKSFRPLTHRMIDAANEKADSGVIDRLLSGAKSVVRVRKVDHAANDDSVEAIVGRMDKALDEGRIADFQALVEKLPQASRAPATAFLHKVEARSAVDKALKDIEGQLKSSLGGASAAAPAPATR